MSGDLLGPIMFVFVFALIFSGYPVAFRWEEPHSYLPPLGRQWIL